MRRRLDGFSSVAGRLAGGLFLIGAWCMPVSATGQPAEPPVAPRHVPFGPSEAIALRTTLISINQANLTGSYAVLHRLLDPDLARTLTVEDLSALFEPWRAKGRDFGFVILVEPLLDPPPSVDGSGTLGLAGVLPTPNFKLTFDLAFRKANNRWALARFVLSDGETTANSEQNQPLVAVPVTPPPTNAPTQTASSDPAPAPSRLPPLPPVRPGF